jgi:hypothetical protein
MFYRNKFPLIFLLGFCVCFVNACKRGPDLVPISGIIKIDGKPLHTGTIRVYQQGYRDAVAEIQKDGSFVFKTLKKGDGCLMGEHPIAVNSIEAVNLMTTRHFIPEKYRDTETANTKIKIDNTTDNLEINLTWKGSGRSGPYIVKSGNATKE